MFCFAHILRRLLGLTVKNSLRRQASPCYLLGHNFAGQGLDAGFRSASGVCCQNFGCLAEGSPPPPAQSTVIFMSMLSQLGNCFGLNCKVRWFCTLGETDLPVYPSCVCVGTGA